MTRRLVPLVLAALLAAAAPVFSQPRPGDDKDATIASLQAEVKRLQTQQMHQGQQVRKDIDDWMWFSRLADIAKVDKVRFTSPKPARSSNQTGQGFGNPMIMSAYTLIPLTLKAGQKAPLIVMVHEGIHSSFDTLQNLRSARELLAEGYVIVAPEYRGSTGYGSFFYDQIDYGGAEIDDTYASQLHARVFQRDGQIYVEDLGSTNGTYLNRSKVTGPMVVQRGDQLQIGNTILELER